jgi:hypothetical protein
MRMSTSVLASAGKGSSSGEGGIDVPGTAADPRSPGSSFRAHSKRGKARGGHEVSSGFLAASRESLEPAESLRRHRVQCQAWKKDGQLRLEDVWVPADDRPGWALALALDGQPVLDELPLPSDGGYCGYVLRTRLLRRSRAVGDGERRLVPEGRVA